MTIEKYKTCALQEMDKKRRKNSASITGVFFRHEYIKLLLFYQGYARYFAQ